MMNEQEESDQQQPPPDAAQQQQQHSDRRSPSWRGNLDRPEDSASARLDPEILANVTQIIESEQAENKDGIQLLFDAIDTNQTGVLEKEELFYFFREAAKRKNVAMEDHIIEMAVDALIEDVAGEGSHDPSTISRQEFLAIFEEHPDMYQAFEAQGSQRVRIEKSHAALSPEERKAQKMDADELWQHARVGLKNRGKYIVWAALYIAACITVFVRTAIKWNNDDEALDVFGTCVVVARASAATLNLNAALILLPVARHSVTWTRITWLRFILFPLDGILDYHMKVGMAIAIFATSHVMAHICDYTRFVHAEQEDLIALLGGRLGEIPEGKADRLGLMMKQRATLTGIIMVICMIAAYSVIRSRRDKFNRFWLLHHLLLLMLVMLCIHGTGNILQHFQSVYWIAGPMALYLIPRLYREFGCGTSLKAVHAEIHQDILDFRVEKPAGWKRVQRPGMYAFVNVPSISRTEWHPFTISSAPAQSYAGFHIKDAGDWTNKLHALAKDKRENSTRASGSDDLLVRLDGPIGASSQGFRDHAVVVLIGAGIGVTPMVSVIRSLLDKRGKVRKAFFYWTVRESTAVFRELMEEIYERDTDQIIEIRHFITSLKRDDRDFGDILFHYAANALHEDTEMDIFLGHRTQQHQVGVGRPNWEVELRHAVKVTQQYGEDDCAVFFCGPDRMAQDIREQSLKLSKKFSDVHLFFSKETF